MAGDLDANYLPFLTLYQERIRYRRHLWVSSLDQTPVLSRLEWQTGQSESLALPPLQQDAVSYIAQNPVFPHAWAIATFQRHVYVSSDNGRTWKHIAAKGTML